MVIRRVCDTRHGGLDFRDDNVADYRVPVAPTGCTCPGKSVPVKIPWQSLPGPTLDRLLEEIVTRDGTDYGGSEKTTEQKMDHARNQLRSGRALLMWNTELESASLVSPEQAAAMELAETGSTGESGST